MALDFDVLMVPKELGLDPVDYQYFHQLLENRTVLFNRDVDENIVESVYLPLRDFEMDSNIQPVTMIFNSPGGSVADGFFLAHYLHNYQKSLKIIVTGYAASMGAVILAGCGGNTNIKRYCYPSSYALIHDGYVALSSAEAKTAEDIMDFNKKVDHNIRDFIIKHTKITPEQYDSKARQQWFLDAHDMLEYGLIDEIIGSDE